MRILVAGSNRSVKDPDDKQSFNATAAAIGQAIIERGHIIIVESDRDVTFDHHAIRGVLSVATAEDPAPVEVHRVAEDGMILRNKPELAVVHTLHSAPLDTRIDRRLKARTTAVNQCDVAILMGGRSGTTTFLELCQSLGKAFVTVPRFGGPAAQAFPHVEQFARGVSGSDDLLARVRDPQNPEAAAVVQLAELFAGHQGYFLSYRRVDRDTQVADHVEVLLRRQGQRVFRDEVSLRVGETLREKLRQQIQASDTFLGLWSTEYAQRESCQAELGWAIEGYRSHGRPKRVALLLIDGTPPPDSARDILGLSAEIRSDREAGVQRLLAEWPIAT